MKRYKWVVVLWVCGWLQISAQECPEACRCETKQKLLTADCSKGQLLSVAIPDMFNAEKIDLSYNIIAHLHDEELTNLNTVQVFNLSNNMIFDVSLRAFHGMPNILVLDLSANRLNSLIPQLFVKNTQLRELYLSNNKLSSVTTGPLLQSTSLQVLDLNSCLISHLFADTFSLLPSLKYLDLGGNLLITIPQNSITSIPLQHLILNNNPIPCDNIMLQFYLVCKKRNTRLQTSCLTKANIMKPKESKMEHKEVVTTTNTPITIETTTDIGSTDNHSTPFSEKCNCQIHISYKVILTLILASFVIGAACGVSLMQLCNRKPKSRQPHQRPKISGPYRYSRYTGPSLLEHRELNPCSTPIMSFRNQQHDQL